MTELSEGNVLNPGKGYNEVHIKIGATGRFSFRQLALSTYGMPSNVLVAGPDLRPAVAEVSGPPGFDIRNGVPIFLPLPKLDMVVRGNIKLDDGTPLVGLRLRAVQSGYSVTRQSGGTVYTDSNGDYTLHLYKNPELGGSIITDYWTFVITLDAPGYSISDMFEATLTRPDVYDFVVDKTFTERGER